MQGIAAVGAIDGSHINVKKPRQNSEVYCNRKSQYTILIQGVCDHKKRFIDFFCGEPGSVHDARLLKKSSLYDRAVRGFLGNDFLLGDSAYPCMTWLIPPFRDNGNLNDNQKEFNYRLSSSRIVIENAFALLKGRFRRLKYFDNDNILYIVNCVVCAAVFHNICLNYDDEIEDTCEISHSEVNDENTNYVENMNISNYSTRNTLYNEMFSD